MRVETPAHFSPVSRRTPTHPCGPTYGGTKKRLGSDATSASWAPGGALHQIASRPSP